MCLWRTYWSMVYDKMFMVNTLLSHPPPPKKKPQKRRIYHHQPPPPPPPPKKKINPKTTSVKLVGSCTYPWCKTLCFPCYLTDLPRQGVMDANDWIIGNVQQYGYYRVNYDKSNWLKLVQQLKTDHAVSWYLDNSSKH